MLTGQTPMRNKEIADLQTSNAKLRQESHERLGIKMKFMLAYFKLAVKKRGRSRVIDNGFLKTAWYADYHVHTKTDKFENCKKTDKMFSVHIIVFELFRCSQRNVAEK